MSRLVLHIGVHKTGSTYFQRFLKRNAAQLARHDVGYPDFCQRANHRELWLATAPVITPWHRSRDLNSQADIDRFRVETQTNLARLAKSHPVAIMSSENLLLHETPAAVEGFRDWLSAIFDEIEIVVFLRRQDYLLPSWYSEEVKFSHPGPPDRGYVVARQHRWNFAELIRNWSAAFGADHVSAFPFLERFKKDHLAVTRQMLRYLGINEDLGTWDPPARDQANISLSSKACQVVQLLSPYVPVERYDGKRNLQRPKLFKEVADRFPGPGVKLTQDGSAAVQEILLPSNEGLRELVPIDSTWDEWFDQPIATSELVPVPTNEEIAATMAELSAPRGPIVWGGPLPKADLPQKKRLLSRVRRAGN